MRIVALAILVFASIADVYGQNKGQANRKVDSSLIASFHWHGGDQANVLLDSLMINIYNNPAIRGYIVIYCGKRCFYGEPEAHVVGIQQALALRKYKADLISIVFGGFREEATTEYWLVPDKACPPEIHPTLGTDKITFVRSRKKVLRPYWCC